MGAGERGGVIVGGLLRTVLGLLAFALVVYDIGAVVVNQVQLPEIAEEAAVAAARGWRERHSHTALAAAAAEALTGHPEVELLAAVVEGSGAAVTVSRRAPVLIADRLPLVGPYATPVVTAHAPLGAPPPAR